MADDWVAPPEDTSGDDWVTPPEEPALLTGPDGLTAASRPRQVRGVEGAMLPPMVPPGRTATGAAADDYGNPLPMEPDTIRDDELGVTYPNPRAGAVVPLPRERAHILQGTAPMESATDRLWRLGGAPARTETVMGDDGQPHQVTVPARPGTLPRAASAIDSTVVHPFVAGVRQGAAESTAALQQYGPNPPPMPVADPETARLTQQEVWESLPALLTHLGRGFGGMYPIVAGATAGAPGGPYGMALGAGTAAYALYVAPTYRRLVAAGMNATEAAARAIAGGISQAVTMGGMTLTGPAVQGVKPFASTVANYLADFFALQPATAAAGQLGSTLASEGHAPSWREQVGALAENMLFGPSMAILHRGVSRGGEHGEPSRVTPADRAAIGTDNWVVPGRAAETVAQEQAREAPAASDYLRRTDEANLRVIAGADYSSPEARAAAQAEIARRAGQPAEAPAAAPAESPAAPGAERPMQMPLRAPEFRVAPPGATEEAAETPRQPAPPPEPPPPSAEAAAPTVDQRAEAMDPRAVLAAAQDDWVVPPGEERVAEPPAGGAVRVMNTPEPEVRAAGRPDGLAAPEQRAAAELAMARTARGEEPRAAEATPERAAAAPSQLLRPDEYDGRPVVEERPAPDVRVTHALRPTVDEQRIAADIAQIAAREYPGAQPQVARRMTDEQGRPVHGAYLQQEGNTGLAHIIAVAMEGARGPRTPGEVRGSVHHEGFHYLVRARLIRPDEMSFMRQEAARKNLIDRYNINQRYPDLSHPARLEEALAEERARWAQTRDGTGLSAVTARVFRRVQAFLDRVRNYMHGQGYRSFDDVFQQISRGEVGRRTPRGEARRGSALQRPDERREPVFYSTLTRAAEQAKITKGTPAQWLATLRNTPGVKPEEVAWSGIEDWLRGRQGTVTREEVSQFLRENEVQVHDVMKGGGRRKLSFEEWLAAQGYTPEAAHEPFGETLRRSYEAELGDENPTKFGQYTLPGGENYRELLLAMPERGKVETRRVESPAGWGDTEGGNVGVERRGGEQDFRSGHYDEPNVLAHVRFNDRVDAEGKRVLHVEEVQSDWHQKGRKQGYASTEPQVAAYYETSDGRRVDIGHGATEEEARAAAGNWPQTLQDMGVPMRFEHTTRPTAGVPDAPFKQSWHELALKRMLRYAAENGYDRLTWTTGEQQAARYDLSTQVNAISVVPRYGRRSVTIELANSKMINLGVDKNGVVDNAPGHAELSGKSLSDVVGKEIADKIMANDRQHTISGEGLKIGGEGMKGFYDRILPAFLNKYGKKWGARVGETAIRTDEAGGDKYDVAERSGQWRVINDDGVVEETLGSRAEAEALAKKWNENPDYRNVHSLDITPAMKEGVQQGQALFQRPEDRLNEPPPTLPPAGSFNPRIGARIRALVPEAVKSAFDDVIMRTVPMAARSATKTTRATAKDFVVALRQASAQLNNAWKDWSTRFQPKQLRAIFDAIDDAHERFVGTSIGGHEIKGETEAEARKALDALPAPERAAADQVLQYAHDLWQRFRDANMRLSGRDPGEAPSPFYAARMLAVVNKDGSFGRFRASMAGEALSLDTMGRNLTTKGTYERKYATSGETQRAAQTKFGRSDIQVVRDIRANLLAFARMERAIAGMHLIDAIKNHGAELGVETISEGERPGYFTLDHPALKQWRPRLKDGEIVKDENGAPVMDRTPLYISKEWEGPLRAVLTKDSGELYQRLMQMKSGATSMIMWSPLTHLFVEYARTLPTMPGKLLSGKLTFAGKQARADQNLVQQAIGEGLSPINGRGFVQDVSEAQPDPAFGAGHSIISRALGATAEAIVPGTNNRVRAAVDAAGNFWHNTLLWDRVANLQFGIWKLVKDDMIAKGHDPRAAGQTAAEIANLYAGAIPQESMSQGARQILNAVFFSRSFTFGNAAVLKNMVVGLSRGTQARIARDVGDLAAASASSYARRKAIGAVALDVALFYVGNAALQAAAGALFRNERSGDEIRRGYIERIHAMLSSVRENPMHYMLGVPGTLFDAANAIFPQSQNEPREQDRVYLGRDNTGRGLYMRSPFSKMFEEFSGWFTHPGVMLHNKLSTLARPILDAWNNDAGFMRQIYDPHAGLLEKIGQSVRFFISQQGPLGQAVAHPTETYRSLHDLAVGTPGQDRGANALRTFGPALGLMFSEGHPGGPVAGMVAEQRRDRQAEITAAMGGINRDINRGNIESAVQAMQALNFTPMQVRQHIASTLRSRSGPTQAQVRNSLRTGTPEQQQRLRTALGAGTP